MSSEIGRSTGHEGFKIIDGGKDSSFEVRLREEFRQMDEEALGITTDEYRTEFAQRVMDSIPTSPLENIKRRTRHNLLNFFRR